MANSVPIRLSIYKAVYDHEHVHVDVDVNVIVNVIVAVVGCQTALLTDHDHGNEHLVVDVNVVVAVVVLGARPSSVPISQATEHAGCVRSQG
ncbi:MAG TPA: hypothetical protein VGQ81_01700 [Acidobacteriota bacterium]|jgi:hypothetical protein|nr:hypothetical protein [Acidobacteriota bacterium]